MTNVNNAELSSKLYEVLGIVRMIGQIQPEGDQKEMLRALETASWSARAAETILEQLLEMET